MSKTAPAPALYCRKCSYDLRGQVEHRCPECGRPYDPADAKTYRRRARGRAGKWIKRIAARLVVLLLIAAAPYAWLYYDWRREQPAVERMKVLGADVQSKRIDTPVLRHLVPHRFDWLLQRVSDVDTSSQPLTDADLILLSRCRRLETLCAEDSVITDRGVEAIAQLPDLRTLWLSGSSITDDSATHLAHCRRLYRLYLDRTSLTDEGLKRLCALPDLITLSIDSPHLTDNGLPALAKLPKLKMLGVSAPALDDHGLAVLSRLSRLQSLFVRADGWTPAGWENLRQSLPNCRVYVWHSSPVPTSAPSTAPAN